MLVYMSSKIIGSVTVCLKFSRANSGTENEIDDSKRVEILRFLVDEAGADITTRVGGGFLLDRAVLWADYSW